MVIFMYISFPPVAQISPRATRTSSDATIRSASPATGAATATTTAPTGPTRAGGCGGPEHTGHFVQPHVAAFLWRTRAH